MHSSSGAYVLGLVETRQVSKIDLALLRESDLL